MIFDKNAIRQGFLALLGKTGNDKYQVPRMDRSTDALIGIDYFHYEAHAKSVFEAWHTLTGKNDGTWLTIFLTTPDTDKEIHLVPTWQASGAAYFRIRKSAVVTANTGTTKATFNRHDQYQTSKTSHVYDNATAPVQGKVMTDVTIANRTPATPGVNGGLVLYEEYDGVGKQTPGGSRDSQERILARGTGYTFEIESDAAGLILALQLLWYEHTPKA